MLVKKTRCLEGVVHLGRVTVDAWQPLVSEVQTTERLADRAFRARRGRERFVVYMEAYTVWTKTAPWSLLAKSSLLAERERLPVCSLVYVLRPRGYRPQHGHFRLQVGRQPMQQVWFREICLWRQEPKAWWTEAPALMALYPLCRQERPAREALAYAAAVITDGATDSIVRADLLTTLAIFGKLAYPRLDVLGLIGREQMRESKIYEEIKDEGRVEGRVEGRCDAMRLSVLEALEIKFGGAARAEFASLLEEIRDSNRLAALHGLALRAKDLSEFRDCFEPH